MLLQVRPLAQQVFGRPIEPQLFVLSGHEKSRRNSRGRYRFGELAGTSPWRSKGGWKGIGMGRLWHRSSDAFASNPQYSRWNIWLASLGILRTATGLSSRSRSSACAFRLLNIVASSGGSVSIRRSRAPNRSGVHEPRVYAKMHRAPTRAAVRVIGRERCKLDKLWEEAQKNEERICSPAFKDLQNVVLYAER